MNIKKIISIYALTYLSILVFFVIKFHYPFPIIFLSSLVIICIYFLSFFIIFLVDKVTRKTVVSRILSTIILTITTYFMIMALVLNFVSNSSWGTNITFSFIIKYSNQIDKLQSTLPMPLYLIYFLIVLFFIVLFYFNLRIIENIIRLLNDNIFKILIEKSTLKEYLYLFTCILLIPLLFFSYSNNKNAWEGEPFTDLLQPYTTIELHSDKEIFSFSKTYKTNNIEDKPNIIIIIADSLRADHIGAYGYERPTTKFLDGLINNNIAIKVENAFSTCAESKCGILSTLSSRPFDEINKNNQKINNVLKGLGYDINLILSADHVWSGLEKHYPPYDLFYDGNQSTKYANTDDQLVIEKLSKLDSYKKPTFFYFHLMSSHSAGIRKKKFEYFLPSRTPHDWFYRLPIIKNIFSTDKKILETNYYDNGVMAADYYISNIFQQLKEKGYMNNSIVWIIGDHGEALGEHGEYGHLNSLYNEETHIPMIIIDSKPNLYKELNYATQLDIAPTILDRLGVDTPKEWKGVSLLKKKIGTNISHHNIPSRKGEKAIIMKTSDDTIYKMLYKEKPFLILSIFNISLDKYEKNNLNNIENKGLVDEFLFQLGQKN